MTKGLMYKYEHDLRDPHDLEGKRNTLFNYNLLDLSLREEIGKVNVSSKKAMASHDVIFWRNREKAGDIENYCRICKKDLTKVCGRYNDYLIFRNKFCPSPICLKCSKTKPDEFHKKFLEAIKKLKGDYCE